MDEILTIDGLSTRYGENTVLECVSLSIAGGEIFGLVGLNGVGKTTLIKAILALVTPTSGRLRIFGEDHQNHASRAKLAYLPENFQPPPTLSGAEYVRFTLSSYGLDDDPARTADLAAGFGLEAAVLDEPMAVYSSGMIQALGLLATFMTAQPLLILDEPMSGLDPKARILLKQQIKNYGKAGKTILLSSHILADLDEICDRIGILHEGSFVYIGTPIDLKQQAGAPSLEQAFLNRIGVQISC